MMRSLTTSALNSATLTLVSALALRAADATIAVVAIAVTFILLTWYAQLGSTDEYSALELTSPAVSTTLAVVGRGSWTTLLPNITAHVVGAVIAGFAALGLESRLPEPLAYDASGLLIAGVGAAIVGIVGAWSTLAVDATGPAAFAAAPVVVAGVLPLGLVGAFSPAVLIGLATAGLLPWGAAGVATAVGFAAAAIGAWAVSALVSPSEAA